MLIVNKLCYKRDLKNAQHFAFIQAFITALQAVGFSASKIDSGQQGGGGDTPGGDPVGPDTD